MLISKGLTKFLLDTLQRTQPALWEAILAEAGLRKVYRSFLDDIGWSGAIAVQHFDLEGRLIKEARWMNQITTDGKNLIRDAMLSSLTGVSDIGVKYLALGSSNAALNAGDHQLHAEAYRQTITTQSQVSTGSGKDTCIVPPTAATGFTWNEVGWFAGAGAINSANTGVMIARVLYNHSHTSAESVQLDRTDTFS